MEAGGVSTNRSSQPPPDAIDTLQASEPCASDLAAVTDGESPAAIRDRVVSGLKHLRKERDTLVKLRNEVKFLRRQRESMHSSRRSTMDAEINLAKQCVENQAAVVAMLEGRDGPFKEKFLNEKRFGRSVKVEVEEEETPSPDQLPPQQEVISATPSQSHSGGLMRVIQMEESPVCVEHMIFSEDEITEDMPDKVKTCKSRIYEKTVFVPFSDASISKDLSAIKPPSLSGDVLCKNDTLLDAQVPAEPVSQVHAGSDFLDVTGSVSAALSDDCATLQHQGASGTAPTEENLQKDAVDMGDVVVLNDCPDKAVSSPVSPAVGPVSALGAGRGASTFAQVVSSGSITRPGQQEQRGSAQTAIRQAGPAQVTTSRAPGPSFAPFPSVGGQRRNVVMLKWEGGVVSPPRRKVVDLI